MIVPLQLSVVVGAVKEGTEHAAVTSAKVGTTGFVLSLITTF